jgi:hypothetical protein
MREMRNKEGMTIIELMISVALVVVIIGISTSSFLALARASSIAKSCADLHGDMRYVFDKISKDIVAATELVSSGSNYIRIRTDRSGVNTDVWYILSGNLLYVFDASVGQSEILLEDVVSFNHTLFEVDGVTATTSPADVFSIDLTLRAERRLHYDTYEDIFQSRIMMRNKF